MKQALPLALLISLLLITLLAGCNKENPINPPVTTAIIYSHHTNGPYARLNDNEEVVEGVYAACRTYQKVIAISVEGEPRINLFPVSQSRRALTQKQLDEVGREQTQNILRELQGSTATSPEVDVLKAIILSGNSLASSVEKGNSARLIIISSGISSTGLLNLGNGNIIDQTPEDIADWLDSQKALPHLNGVDVVWYGLGQPSGEQTISYLYQSKLAAIWETILLRAGANSVKIDKIPIGTGTENTLLPPVTVIDFPTEGDILTGIPEEGIVFTEKTLNFKGDSAEFLDPTAAEAVLAPVAHYLKNNPDFRIIIAGTTATGNDTQRCNELSLERAQAVAGLLERQGVAVTQLRVVGLGFENDPFHVDDIDMKGNYTDIAYQNRKVVLFPYDSPSENEDENITKIRTFFKNNS